MHHGTFSSVNLSPPISTQPVWPWGKATRAILAVFLGILGSAQPWLGHAAEVPSGPKLTNFMQVLSLGVVGARDSGYPVQVRGVVAYPSRGGRDLMCLQDGTNGLAVGLLAVSGLDLPISARPKVGDLVVVDGLSGAGSSHPYVTRATARVIGSGQLPAARPATASEIASGQLHGKMVFVRGVVLDVARVRGRVDLLMNSAGHGFYATISEETDHLPVDLLNGSVELQGMAWNQFDGAGKPNGFKVLVGLNSWVRVLRPGSSNLFANPRATLAAVSQSANADDRLVVTGVVNYAWPSHFIALQDETGAAIAYPAGLITKTTRDGDYVTRPPRGSAQPGDLIEMVGTKFTSRAFSPVINEVEYRIIGHEDPPPAPLITEAEALTGAYDCRRVRIRGRILDRDGYEQNGAKVSRVHIRFDEHITTAVYAGQNREEFLAPTGSRVELTGLCLVSAGKERPVRAFSFFLSSPDDVKVLPEPPVWMSPAALRVGGVAGGITAFALGWVWLLRRQVARRTGELRSSNERLAAEVQERVRAESHLAARMKLLALNAEMAEALNESAELQPMLQRCAAGLVRHLEAAFARVWTLNESGQLLELQASAGLYTHLDGPHSKVPLGQFKIGLIAQEKTAHVTNDVPNDPRVSDPEWARREGMAAFAGFPILLGRRVLGVVAIFARSPIRDEAMTALESVARSLALGIERKRTEAELVRALERERELGELKTSFVSMVSHEFRTPLEIIVSSADILDRYLDRLPPEDRVEHLRAIQSSVQRMSGMMEDVLLLGRFESAHQPFRPDDVHLKTCCRRVADEIRSATSDRCPIRLDLDDTLPLARADEHLLRHILNNLLSNAVKYSSAGAPVRLQLAREGVHAVLVVEDSGLGIPVADQARLFEAFHRGHNTSRIPGTGLGLVIVKRSVELHGGRIEFASEEGKGTRFTVRLPVFNESTP